MRRLSLWARFCGAVACLAVLGACSWNGEPSDSETEVRSELPAGLKTAFGADPNKVDTDGDGLSDDFEIRSGFPKIRPDLADTDGDGLDDAKEDTDGDGLDNFREQQIGTSPLFADTDEDGLPDRDEAEGHRTDPLNRDTDGDGVGDGREVANGSDPRVPDADKVVTSLSTFHTINISNGAVERVQVAMTGPGDLAARVSLGTASDKPVPGQVGRRLEIVADAVVKATMTSASVTLPYDAASSNAVDPSQLAIYTINPATGFWEALPGTVDPVANTITGTTTHFSPFLVANRVVFEDSLSKLAQTCDKVSDPSAFPSDVVLVIDSSGSMRSNDPQDLRISAARNFIGGMKATDRVAVVDFDDGARLAIGLSADQAAISSAIGTIDSSGGTDIGAGVSVAIDQIKAQSDVNKNRVIILLTDGVGAYSDSLTQTMVAEGIRAFTIGLSGSVNQSLLQWIATETQGAYKQIDDASGLNGIFTEFASVFGDTGLDTDEDGLTDCQEIQGVYVTSLHEVVRTDPTRPDTDGDGLADGAELGIPVKTSVGAKSPWVAPGYSDPREGKADSDGDGISDPDEFRLGTNPLAQDTDSDSLSDLAEIELHATNPVVADTDDDGLDDGIEVSRAAEGFDPAVYDYRVNSSFRWELFKGFIAGDLITVDTTPELIGQIVSGVAVFGDVRDFLANLFQGEWAAAGISAVGVAPLVGDAGKAGALAARFVAKFPNKANEVIRYVDKYVPEGVAKYLPGPALKVNAAWALSPLARGKEIEKIVAPTIPGRALLGSYPGIDVFNPATGNAVSIKSLDLDAKTYQSAAAFRRTLNRYADSLLNFSGAPGQKLADGSFFDTLRQSDITSRELVLVVPRSLSTEFDALLAQVAAAKGLKISTTVLP